MQRESQNNFGAYLEDANRALERAAHFLRVALDGIPDDANEVAQLIYVKQQAGSVLSVALDVHLLIEKQRFQNIVGLCRIAFESRIHLYAAMRVRDFAAQKYLAQMRGHVDELEELIKDGVQV